ncbi:MAG: carboxypeptidase regulatory-like domain-containing protein [Candidatus Rokubacteria bacterium]|nr:carboxypeptidase regulatory-like domain-containing protein [Candidatus Rokubacteria bacterium]MBI4593597.1 carboxypeptidase regulatory-like domain-containing protein [Candidatus Rokubacteria bacterium]
MKRLPPLAPLGLALGLAVGCQSPPAPAAVREPQTITLASQARRAVAERDCRRAAPLLRAAIAQGATAAGLHYDLAVCATHLDALDEATREFQWVLAHMPEGSAEARAARGWLTEAGVVLETATMAGEPAPAPGPGGDALLTGRAVWGPPGETPRPRASMLLHLSGVAGSSTQGEHQERRTDEDGRFLFKDLVPGDYKLSDRIAGRPFWRLRVSLQPGRETALELTPANSVQARDDFPEPAR